MAGRTLDLIQMLSPDQMAQNIANEYSRFEILRQNWLDQKQEVRDYIFSIDTTTTSTSSLPWKNSTHIPKLCQIRDNLHANYIAAMFPNDQPIAWEGDDESSETKDKRSVIEAYMGNKLRMGGFRNEVSKCLLDYIDYGNCFATVEYVAEQTVDPVTGETIPGFVGPRLRRISPVDIVFNPAATTFAESPKIVRSLKTLGNLRADIEDHPELGYYADVFEDVLNLRRQFSGLSAGDFKKNNAFQIDGFSSWFDYFNSDYVEILDFYGDLYDVQTDTLYKNYMISVVDRCKIIRKQPNPSWLGTAPIFHVGWRIRPDNLYAMGPLDNLVGMQYRIDHLENAKADAWDLMIHPITKIKGYVEDFEYGPGERIYMGDDGDVEFLRPETTMLNSDNQIMMYEMKMEEMAGAPKQAMGFRTPGEKTAYEVQILENGANRVFINKTSYFEEVFLEPALNAMLEVGRRSLDISDTIRVIDDEFGAVNFLKITKEDLAARGKIRPIGARHFARNANIVQNLTQFFSSPLGQDASVNAHISGKRLAHLIFDELFGLEAKQIVQDNIRVAETLETQKQMHDAQQLLQERQGPQGVPGDPNANIDPMAQGGPASGSVPVQRPVTK